MSSIDDMLLEVYSSGERSGRNVCLGGPSRWVTEDVVVKELPQREQEVCREFTAFQDQAEGEVSEGATGEVGGKQTCIGLWSPWKLVFPGKSGQEKQVLHLFEEGLKGVY